jgi:hypothetical protein
MRILPTVIALASMLSALGRGLSQSEDSIYSRRATYIWGDEEKEIRSPDGRSAIFVRSPRASLPEETHFVFVRSEGHDYPTHIGELVNAEVSWSPDSRAFFLTYSDGGAVGTYHVKIVYLTPRGLHVVEPISNGRVLSTPKCLTPERPNVGAITWPRGISSRLVIAVEVPPHSSCASMGTFRAFEIALPRGRVLRRYTQKQAKRVFANEIGIELQEADDSCATMRRSCLPCGLGGSCGQPELKP